MFSIERSVGSGTFRICCVSCRIEPKPEVIELYGIGCHPFCRLRDDGGWAWKYVGRRRRWDARGNNEGLDIEPADEIAHTYALRIGDNIADIPGKPKRRVWNVKPKQIKIHFWR